VSGEREWQDPNRLGEFMDDWVMTRTGRSIGTVASFDLAAAVIEMLATGPVPVGDVRQEWGVRDSDGRMLWEHMTSERGARDFTGEGMAVVRRTVSTSPWVVADA
jgi:hypothetical protein